MHRYLSILVCVLSLPFGAEAQRRSSETCDAAIRGAFTDLSSLNQAVTEGYSQTRVLRVNQSVSRRSALVDEVIGFIFEDHRISDFHKDGVWRDPQISFEQVVQQRFDTWTTSHEAEALELDVHDRFFLVYFVQPLWVSGLELRVEKLASRFDSYFRATLRYLLEPRGFNYHGWNDESVSFHEGSAFSLSRFITSLGIRRRFGTDLALTRVVFNAGGENLDGCRSEWRRSEGTWSFFPE